MLCSSRDLILENFWNKAQDVGEGGASGRMAGVLHHLGPRAKGKLWMVRHCCTICSADRVCKLRGATLIVFAVRISQGDEGLLSSNRLIDVAAKFSKTRLRRFSVMIN